MTAPTLAAIVEAAAEATYEKARSLTDGDHPMHDMPWASLTGFIQHHWRQEALPTVTATLAALQPLVDQWERLADDNDRLGDWQDEQGRHGAALRAYGSRDAHNAVANQLRALMPATTGEKL